MVESSSQESLTEILLLSILLQHLTSLAQERSLSWAVNYNGILRMMVLQCSMFAILYSTHTFKAKSLNPIKIANKSMSVASWQRIVLTESKHLESQMKICLNHRRRVGSRPHWLRKQRARTQPRRHLNLAQLALVSLFLHQLPHTQHLLVPQQLQQVLRQIPRLVPRAPGPCRP